MDQPREENPYQSPETADVPAVDREKLTRRVRLAWQYPLLGLLPLAGMWLGALLWFQTSLMQILLVACVAATIAGATMTIYGIFCVSRLPSLFPHVLAGVTANVLYFLIAGGSAFVMAFMLRPA